MHRRELLKTASAFAATLPFFSPATLLAQGRADPYLAYVHPELRPIAAQMLKMFANAPAASAATLQQQRRGMEAYSVKPLADVPYEQRLVSGAKGQPPVRVYLVNAGKAGSRPAIVHTHGGGYIAGTALGGIAGVQALCKELDCVAVTVDYRLAPETTYRGSIEDNYAALKWLHANAASLGIDPARIAVMGESAGGGHAALLAITARDRGEVRVAFQCLVYPMLDDRTGTSRKVPAHVGRLIWTADSNRFGWQSFLGMIPGGAASPVGAVPARVADLAGLPPAFIGVGSIDLFHDEDVDYAQRLNAAGVPAELIVVPGAFHGFDGIPSGARIAARFNAAKIEALRSGLGIEG
jgi:acetyl esterase/lipase